MQKLRKQENIELEFPIFFKKHDSSHSYSLIHSALKMKFP